jgi:hypothetical protein
MDKSMNIRLEQVMQSKNLGVTSFAREIGIGQSALSVMIKGERIWKGQQIHVPVSKNVKRALFEKLGVSRTWFETGTGPMFEPKTPDETEEWRQKYYKALERIEQLVGMLSEGAKGKS